MGGGKESSPKKAPPPPPPPPLTNQEQLDYCLEQIKRTGEELERRSLLLSKESVPRRTEERITQYGKSCLNFWNEIIDYDKEIKKLAQDTSISYFTDDYFGFLEKIKNKMKKNVEKVLPNFFVELEEEKEEKEEESFDNDDNEKQKSSANLVAKRNLKMSFLSNYINRIENNDLNDLSIEELEVFAKRCDSYFDKFSTDHARVLSMEISELDKGQIIQEYEAIEEKYQALSVDLEVHISRKKADAVGVLVPQQLALPSQARLPKIEIPKFNGDISNWPEFRDLFASLIHNKSNIPKIEKLQYLKMNLSDSAAGVIKHLQVSGKHYDSAWNALNKRYNNKRLLINTHLKRLFSLKYVNSENSKELRELLDETKEIICMLDNLGEPTTTWNSILVFIVVQRMPSESTSLWEGQVSKHTNIPLFAELEQFIESRFQTIDMVQRKNSYKKKFKYRIENVHAIEGTPKHKCPMCNADHAIFSCSTFNKMQAVEKFEVVKKMKLCTVCLQPHMTRDCTSNWKCFKCGRKHNTTLHIEKTENVHSIQDDECEVLLPTAIIKVEKADGTFIFCRALIDQGATTSMISEDTVSKLQLLRKQTNTYMKSFDGLVSKSRGMTTIKFRSRFDDIKNEFSANVNITRKITSWLPSKYMELRKQHAHLKLADPHFDVPGPIDILLGAKTYKDILLYDVQKNILLAQETHLGYIISGGVTDKKCNNVRRVHLSTISLENEIKKFWEIEEKNVNHPNWSTEENLCEQFYVNTTIRGRDGRYTVRLPFKTNNKKLGRSRHIAISNFLKLEKKFRTNPELKKRFNECIHDYILSGHAEASTKPENYFLRKNGEETHYNCFYLPSLAVIKEDSTSTKTRVVYNASNKSSNSVSLNDLLMVGPTIQPDVVKKINRFRLRRFAFISDITKMYRQIKMHPDDWAYQRFIWRENEEDPIQEFELTTVTFGEASAPFSAIRTIKQLAMDCEEKFPKASDILLKNCYVDDVHQVTDSLEDAIESKNQLIMATESAGFELRKWASNHSEILAGMPTEHRENGIDFEKGVDASVKTLGLKWFPKNDCFQYKFNMNKKPQEKYTKRILLMEIATIYDPLGWIQPLVVSAKLIMQEVWKIKIEWDELLPEELVKKWMNCKKNFDDISSIKIPRWIKYADNVKKYQLMGFCDASQAACGAAVYLRVIHDDHVSISLIMSKSKVAPLKVVTIPRLELVAAVLLSELIEKILDSWEFDDMEIFCWSDSRIVLAWIQAESYDRWKPFVRNRVTNITNVTKRENWHYVNTKQNPADKISRGCNSEDLDESWWYGPHWLPEWTPDSNPTSFETSEESKDTTPRVFVTMPHDSLLYKYSSFHKTCRVIAWMLRFVDYCKKDLTIPKDACLTSNELKRSKAIIIKLLQKCHFSEEIDSLTATKAVNKKSKLFNLCPFIDGNGIIRVGGRLSNADIPFNSKHPIVMPSDDHVTRILIQDMHKQCLHGGKTLTLATVREEFWILQGTKVVKSVVHRCVICAKNKAKLQQQLMGQLPPSRVNLNTPFEHCGVDLAGPIWIKTKAGRGAKSMKSYIVAFVCMATKATHFELATDLTTVAFIGAFQRFIARRSTPKMMYSDNGTNIKSAFKYFMRLFKEHTLDINHLSTEMEKFCIFHEIIWKPIPEASPMFGGLWERNIGSLKHHLRRVIGESVLTFEEMYTVLTLIENVLNSRPLCPISDDIEDIGALTPNHFLFGRMCLPMPENYLLNDKESMLKRWQLVQRKYQEITHLFKKDYLNRLQQRPKWAKITPNVTVGQLYLIQDENKYVNQWKLGRVIQTHPGADGLVRVVTLKTQNGQLKRPITKLSPLPIDIPQESGAIPEDNQKNDTQERKREQDVPMNPREQPLGRRRSPRLNPSMVISLLIGFMLASVALGEEINASNLTYASGIHFIAKGSINAIASKWTYIIQYDISDINTTMTIIDNNINSLQDACNESIFRCEARMRNLIEENEFATDHYRKAITLVQKRKRRAVPIMAAIGIGAAAGAVVIGAERIFSYFFNKEIDALKEQQAHIMSTLFNQTSVMYNASQILELMDNDTVSRVQEVNTALQNIENALNKIEIQQKFDELAEKIMNDISKIKSIYNAIIKAGNQQAMSLSLFVEFNGTNFENHLSNISAQLPDDQQLISHHMYEEMLQIPQFVIIENHLQFIFYIPVPYKQNMDAYQLIAIPIIHENEMFWVEPMSDFIAVDSSLSFHILPYQKCKIIGGKRFCELGHPLTANDNEKMPCERGIFYGESLPIECLIRKTNAVTTWIKIDEDTWAFVIRNNLTLPSGQILSGTGILTDGNSLISSDNNVLTITDTVQITSIISPKINLTSFLEERPHVKTMAYNPTIKKQLASLHQNIDQVASSSTMNTHDIHHYSLIYTIIIFAIICFIIKIATKPTIVDHGRFFRP